MKRPSMREQINEMCKQCVYDPKGEGTWKEQVKNCKGSLCPLYHLRPLPEGVKHEWQIELSEKWQEDVKNGKRSPIKRK